MHARNLPLYQSSAGWPVSGQEAPVAPSADARHTVITEFRGRRRPGAGLFWFTVAAVAVAVGVITWFVF